MPMEEDRNRTSLEEASSLAANAAHSILRAARAGRDAAGMAAGAAAGGPLGAVLGFVVTRKTFWKVFFAICLSILLLIMVIANFFGILLARFGLLDAEGYVRAARSRERILIQEEIDRLKDQQPEAFEELFAALDERWEKMNQEIQADYQENYGSFKRYEMEVTDEYTDRFKPDFSGYLSVLLAQSWSGSQIRSFLGSGTVDLYRTKLTSDYEDYFLMAQERYGVDKALLMAIAKVGSGFDPNAVSSAGAKGIMQLMPKTAAALGVSDPFDPEQSILGGAKYLADSLTVFGGYENSVELAIASYHAGVSAVKKAGYRIPQNGQTPTYVKNVMEYVELVESGSLTPGRESRQETNRKQLKMFLGEVYSRENDLFCWEKEGVREEERETVRYFQNGREISQTEYDRALREGEEGLHVEKTTETWHVVSYRIINLLNATLPEMEGEYRYKYVTTPKRFLQALKMLQFLLEEPDEDAFVREFGWKELVDGHDAFENSYSTDIVTSGENISYDTAPGCVTEVAYYNQIEEPWAEVAFCGTTIRKSGCGPTCMAMVISTLTKKTITPEMLAEYTEREGLYVPGRGCSHNLPRMAAENWGLSVKRVKDTELSEVARCLRQGAMAVVICGEYTITGSGSGHYIVLTGVTKEGYFSIADPASRERSQRLYDPDTIQAYARDLEEGSIWIVQHVD